MAISNTDDLIDSRDVIARIEELRAERAIATIRAECIHCGLEIEGCELDDDWRDRGNNAHCSSGDEHEPPNHVRGELSEDEAEELAALESLQEEVECYSDWEHGATLIRDSFFDEYAQELAVDIGAIDRDPPWPVNCIDWEQAERELQQDYSAVEFNGVTYWIR